MRTFNIYYHSMNKIIHKQQFSEKVFCLEVETPLIARSCRPGNFIIVRVDNHSERVPYTIAKSDPTKGTITMVIQEVGRSSTKLCQLNEGDEIADIVGPLGTSSHIENYGTIICAGGGIGIAAILPILTALKQAGNKVISVLAGRTKELVIMVDDVKKYSDEVIIMTDDGSYGEKGVITVGVEKVIQREHVDKVLAIGPPIMMKFTSLLAKKYGIPNDVSLNTIMVDGTGMCGACRLTIGGKTRFVCIDGPEFDGDLVDWDEMFKRMGTFKDIETSPNPPPKEGSAWRETSQKKRLKGRMEIVATVRKISLQITTKTPHQLQPTYQKRWRTMLGVLHYAKHSSQRSVQLLSV